MINEDKIREMARNELYLATQYKRDRFAIRYFKSDYVALERLKCLIVFAILYIIYWVYYVFRLFYVESADMLHFDYQGIIIKAAVWMILLGVVVALIATLVASYRYEQASKRIYEHEDKVEEIVEM